MLLAYSKMAEIDRISLKRVRITSRAQIVRAVLLGFFFALVFVWALPGGLGGA